MKPTLFVLAAGMGSRYGGLKQLDGVGPNGETIMDFSIFDAIRGGFGKVVFVIRKDFEADFREKIITKYENHIPVELVFQAIDNLPEGFTAPADRQKPWGTNHAVLMGKSVINEPFAVINADDYYGRDSFAVLAKELMDKEGSKGDYSMVGYRVGNTLSESGSVARGVCAMDENRMLTDVVERTAISRIDGAITFTDENGVDQTLEENTPVSMNMGFYTRLLRVLGAYLQRVLDKGGRKPEIGAISLAINTLINSGEATVKVLDTTSKWFGVTYAQDRPDVVAKLQALVDTGEYPSPLFK